MKREQVKQIISQLCDENGLKEDEKETVLWAALSNYDEMAAYEHGGENSATRVALSTSDYWIRKRLYDAETQLVMTHKKQSKTE